MHELHQVGVSISKDSNKGMEGKEKVRKECLRNRSTLPDEP